MTERLEGGVDGRAGGDQLARHVRVAEAGRGVQGREPVPLAVGVHIGAPRHQAVHHLPMACVQQPSVSRTLCFPWLGRQSNKPKKQTDLDQQRV